MSEAIKKRVKPDIRAITRLVPPEGNLVQGQSELPIDPELASMASKYITESFNHYGGSEGYGPLRDAVKQKVQAFNKVAFDNGESDLIITNGGTGALISYTASFLRGKSALVFEPYYPYHVRIIEHYGGKAEVFSLDSELRFNFEELREFCEKLIKRTEYPLEAIILCSPANPTGKIFNITELEAIAEVAKGLGLTVVSDEVYEHFSTPALRHISIASLEGMSDRTITVNSFSKSWNISGWRLGYAFGPQNIISKMNAANNVVYVCPATPLQAALSEVVMKNNDYYKWLAESFLNKRTLAAEKLSKLGFRIYESGSTFYLWAKIPESFTDSVSFNELLMQKGGVGVTPGSAFADSELWDDWVRICIARTDERLAGALERIEKVLS
jgi:aminotransferase